MSQDRAALFGGTFDPIHNAHLAIARAAVRECGLSRVTFVPAANPPHKPQGPTALFLDRLRMVRLACEGEPDFEVSDIEGGGGKSYSILTIEQLRPQYFIIGADAFAEIATWYRWQDVLRSVEFIVVSRPGHQVEVPGGARVHVLSDLHLPTSSSEIRRRLASGERPSEIPKAVLEYIQDHRLYGVTVHAGNA